MGSDWIRQAEAVSFMDLVDLQKDLRRIPVVELETPTVVRTYPHLCCAFMYNRIIFSGAVFDVSTVSVTSAIKYLSLPSSLSHSFSHSLLLLLPFDTHHNRNKHCDGCTSNSCHFINTTADCTSDSETLTSQYPLNNARF